MARKTRTSSDRPSERQLKADLKRVETELAIQEARYTQKLFAKLERLAEADDNVVRDDESNGWMLVAQGGSLVDSKRLTGASIVTDLAGLRRESYRRWRLDAHARSILRNYAKYIVGRNFRFDFHDTQRGRWDGGRIRVTNMPDDPLAVSLIWQDFVHRTRFSRRAKEIVLRGFRDGEYFIRRFEHEGRIDLRFVEPEYVTDPVGVTGTLRAHMTAPHVTEEDAEAFPDLRKHVGKRTTITSGIEHLDGDVETVVAYYITTTLTSGAQVIERVSIADIEHGKPMADMNDVRGFPLLEVVLKKLANYEQWEEYRMVLNKARTAIALVRKIEGTSGQAASLLAGRLPAREAPAGRDPQTSSARREAMFRMGTVLTPGPGVSYDFISPRLGARDASEDGRRFLLTIAAGVGIPEMLLTGSYENAAYASTVTAMDAVQREWEDWQEYFGPTFERIFRWVIDAAVLKLGLPEETDRGVTLLWPMIFPPDVARETERRERLYLAGVLSRRTWAAQEGLVYDDELDNIRHDSGEPQPGPPGGPDSKGEGEQEGLDLGVLSSLDEWLNSHDQTPMAPLTEAKRAASLIQTLIFDKKTFTKPAAVEWARRHGFSAEKVDETESSYRIRQHEPHEFKDGSFRTIPLKDGVKAVIGRRVQS